MSLHCRSFVWVTTENYTFTVVTLCRRGLFQQIEDVLPDKRIIMSAGSRLF